MERENLMKNVESEEEDDLRPEYDFSEMKGGVRGKYVERYRQGTNMAVVGHVPFEVGLRGALAARQRSIEHFRGYIKDADRSKRV